MTPAPRLKLPTVEALTNAIAQARALLKANADPSDTPQGTLDKTTMTAIEQLAGTAELLLVEAQRRQRVRHAPKKGGPTPPARARGTKQT
jgi:hypothetical protein